MSDLERLQRELCQLPQLCRGSDQGCPIIDSLDKSG
tara:strand:+ start:675 stop:782 length:108 start_codon:yes stop_codon:yes gene_type:complete